MREKENNSILICIYYYLAKSVLLETENCYIPRSNSEADLPISVNTRMMNFVTTKRNNNNNNKNLEKSVTKLVEWTHTWVLARSKTPCVHRGRSFSEWICAADNDMDAVTEEHKLYSVAEEWRSRNRVCRSTSQPDSGGDTKHIGGSK